MIPDRSKNTKVQLEIYFFENILNYLVDINHFGEKGHFFSFSAKYYKKSSDFDFKSYDYFYLHFCCYAIL